MVLLLPVEHVRAQIQHSALVHLSRLPVPVEVRLVQHNELIDALDQIGFIHLLLKLLPAQVRQGNEEMHKDADLHGLPDELQDAVHDVHGLLGLVGQVDLAPLGVDHIGEHGGGEIQAEHVDLNGEWSLDQLEHPVDDIVVEVGSDDGLLDRTLLEHRQAEALGDIAVVLLV